MDDLLLQRLVSPFVDIDRDAGDREHRQHVGRRGVEIDVAEHRGDGVGRPAVGDQQQQRLGVVDAAIGIEDQAVHSLRIRSATLSPIMIEGALVLPEVSVGMIEASATRRPWMPCTRSLGSTTAIGSMPILQVPTGW